MLMTDIDYSEEAVTCRGFVAYDDTASGKRPGVLVFHEGLGLGEHIIERTRRVAKLGYVALAADMFGDRRQARDLEDMRRLVGDLRNDPTKLRARARAALATLGSLPQVNATRLCAIGFCFGGSVVLELARDGADLKAVVSFHGVLATKAPALPGKVNASVLVLTGANDRLAPPEHVTAPLKPRCARQAFGIGRSSRTATPTMPSPTLQPRGLSSRAHSTMSNRIADRGQR